MIYVCNSVIAIELFSDWQIYKNIIFEISEKVQTNDHYPLNIKFSKKIKNK